jgi:UDP-glucose 4-epimerase
MRRRVPDTTRLRNLTGWQPTRALSAILTEVIAEARSTGELVPAVGR